MAKHKASLDLIHNGTEKQINIFVHGCQAITSQKEYDDLTGKIISCKPAGKVYLYSWKSGDFAINIQLISKIIRVIKKGKNSNPYAILLDLTITAVYNAVYFKYFEKRAEQYGNEFKQHLSKIKYAFEYPVNFIGHSLGARMIFFALANNNWGKYKIEDIVFLGGAADVKSNDWDNFINSYSGTLYNAYSKNDNWLTLTPDFRKRVGRYPINYPSSKIINRNYPSFGHTCYWKRLDYILRRLWKGKKTGKDFF